MGQVDLRPHLEEPSSLPRATTLLREMGLRAVLFHIKAAETLPEHNLGGALAVLCLRGQCTFVAGAKRMEMSANILASLGPGVPHSVMAEQDTLLLVVMAEPPP